MLFNIPPPRKLYGLTVIRFFAAAWVYFFHSSLWIGQTGWIAAVSSVGYVGVSVFFVLSGFILSYNYLDRDFTKFEFWSARVARIVPVYWLSLVLAAPYVAAKLIRHESPLSANLILTPLFLQSWNPAAAHVWNPPAWSISTEAFFYLLFPFAVRPVVNWFSERPVSILLLFWIAGAVPSILYALLHPEGFVDESSAQAWLETVKFNPLFRLPEFLFGVCIGAGFRDGWRVPFSKLLIPCCIVSIGSLLVAAQQSPYPMLHNGLFAPLFGLLILSIASDDKWLDWKPLVVLGEASYSLYILADPLGNIYHSASKRFHWLPPQAQAGGFAIFFALCVACSVLVYIFLEMPTRKRLRNFLVTRKQIVSVN
jgi:peptidoglycan/LPS O-acetylase OafA/YrhL